MAEPKPRFSLRIQLYLQENDFVGFSHVSPSSSTSTSSPDHPSPAKHCPASLYYVTKTRKSLEEAASLFRVNSNAVNRTHDGFLISINCSCLPDRNEFTWRMDYTVQPGDTWDSVPSKFGSFVLEKLENVLIPWHNVTLDLLCGCHKSMDIMTYRVKTGDTLFKIRSRFDADADKTAKLNGMKRPWLLRDGDVIFIPVPDLQHLILLNSKDTKAKKLSKRRIQIVVGVTLVALTIVLLSVILAFSNYHKRKGTQQLNAYSRRVDSLPCCLTKFPFHTICDATSNFSLSLKIGQGSFGSVYLGKLRGLDVAIKQMKNTKSKEFLSELNILCKVHHSNLIELIGYAAGGDSLFLVYEYAQNGALSDHLHRPAIRGYKPLPWITRVQIALDAAKGLEYIHGHTNPYYVHRDVKTSNILLDSNFQAKIADFGLVKLFEQSPEVGAAASRIVGTFGYLAPEYVRDGCVTMKIDVYAFGVVIMELLTGQPALSRDATLGNDSYNEYRSPVEYILSALNEIHDPLTQLTKCIDPNLPQYHKDSLFQMALLSKYCVDDNWNQRPDMSNVVLRLSEILSCSKKWEKLEYTY